MPPDRIATWKWFDLDVQKFYAAKENASAAKAHLPRHALGTRRRRLLSRVIFAPQRAKTMGLTVDDDGILGIILNGPPEESTQVKLLADSQNDFDLPCCNGNHE